MTSTRRFISLSGVSLLLVGGCHRPAAPAIAAPTTNASVTRTRRVSDEHVAGIALMANNVEIRYALLAPARAADPDVKTYAARLHTDHTSLNASLTDLLSQIDLPAQDDPAGLALRDASTARRARLEELGGRAFDLAYLDVDVESHRELLDIIDRVLLPSASRRGLSDYVRGLRPAVAAHLAHAEQLRATLAARRQ